MIHARRMFIGLVCGAVASFLPPALEGQASAASEIIDLNRRMMHEQIVDRSAGLFQELALEQFLVVAPGGRVENREEAIRGVAAFSADSIDIRDERVVFQDDTAVLVGRLQIHGEMRPVGVLPPMKFMAVFVDGPDGWRILSRSLTPCFEIAVQNGFC